MSQISGNVVINISLVDTQLRPVFTRQSIPGGSGGQAPQQTFPVFGNELITALNQHVPPGGVTISLPSGSGQTVAVTATSLADNIATYTFTPVAGVTIEAGQNISVINCTNNSVFNVTNAVILNATVNQFTVAITNADIASAAETVASATTSGVSMVYLRNVGNGTINVTWTPSGGASEVVLPLPAGAEIMMTFPDGNCGITALSLSSNILQSATVTNVALTSNVATLTTATSHGFSVGQLVTTTGITNNSNLFDVTAQLITSIPSPTTFTFVLVHANVNSAAATGSTPEATVTAAQSQDDNQPQVEYAILG
jgi:hypothetical protein